MSNILQANTLLLTKRTGDGLWKHTPDNAEPFYNGQYRLDIRPDKFAINAASGRMCVVCPVSGVTVIDETNGNATTNTSNYDFLAATLYVLRYPGFEYPAASGGGGTSYGYRSLIYWDGNDIVVPAGLTDILIFNTNYPGSSNVGFNYSGTAITEITGAEAGDQLLILANTTA